MERLSQDTTADLIAAYKASYHLESGKIVRDIGRVWTKLTDWLTIEEAENIIPFIFAEPKQMPVGYRIWTLSRNKNERYYCGNFFDCIISDTGKRTRRQKCKLSNEAIKFFEAKHDN